MAKIRSRAKSGEYEVVRAIGAHFGRKGDAYGLAVPGFHEADRSDKPDLLDIAVPDEASHGSRSGGHFGSVARYNFGVHRASEYVTRTTSLLAGVSWDRPLVEDQGPRYREAAAVMDRSARGLLWKISDCTFIPGAEALDLIDDYDDLRAVVRVVAAGWVSAAPDGLLVTDRGRDVASQLFVDR